MPTLTLVRHSQTAPQPAVPASQWLLSETGRARCQLLAERLAPGSPQAIFSSQEPKALETAALISSYLRLPVQMVACLHEHLREGLPLVTQAEFQAKIECLFAHPDILVFGDETANQACQRFTQAIQALVSLHPAQNMLVVSHGTVISLFLARHCDIDPLPFWRRLGMPAYVVLQLSPLEQPQPQAAAAFNLLEICETIA
jgi:broad specificity phosphatase PhoE